MTIPKKVTLESLAVMIQKGFSEHDERFVKLEKRLGSLEKKVDDGFKSVQGRQNNIDRRLDSHATDIAENARQIAKLVKISARA